jgi:hypothetical protein
MDGAEDGVKQMVRETYRWLMVPTEEMVRGKLALRWEAVACRRLHRAWSMRLKASSKKKNGW